MGGRTIFILNRPGSLVFFDLGDNRVENAQKFAVASGREQCRYGDLD